MVFEFSFEDARLGTLPICGAEFTLVGTNRQQVPESTPVGATLGAMVVLGAAIIGKQYRAQNVA